MKVKNIIARKLGVSVDNLVILRIGGWLQDEVNPWQMLPEGDLQRPGPKLFDPDLPTVSMSYYAEVCIMMNGNMGQKFSFEFRPADLEG